MRRRLGGVVVVPVPPPVRRVLRIALWRVLPSLLTTEWCNVEVAPDCPHCLITAVVDQVCAKHPLAIPEEHVVPMPLIDAEVFVKAVCDGVPGHFPPHARLQARYIRLGRA